MRCFISGCDSTSNPKSKFRINGGKSHFFTSPKTEEKLQIWQNAISASGCQPKQKVLKSGDRLCHLHFKHEDILWMTPEYKMPDGKIFVFEREKPKLKANAVPSVFKIKKKREYAQFNPRRNEGTWNGEHLQEESDKISEQRSPLILSGILARKDPKD